MSSYNDRMAQDAEDLTATTDPDIKEWFYRDEEKDVDIN